MKVRVRTEDGNQEFEDAVLVGADGASSSVKRFAVKSYQPDLKEPKLYASIQEWHRVLAPMACYGAMFDQKVTDYYSWTIPKTVGKGREIPAGNYVLLGSAIPVRDHGRKTDVRERFEQLREDMSRRGMDVSAPVKTSGAFILRPRMFGSIYDGKDRVFLCGEAAGLISPSSSEGISFAMRSGEALAKSLGACFLAQGESAGPALSEARKRYQAGLRPLKISIAFKSLKSPIMYLPLPRKLVFMTRALSMKVLKESERWT